MYLTFSKQTNADFTEENINSQYSQGFLFTRIDKGHMYQTRSVRVDLSKFELSSENRRVLKKTEGLSLNPVPLPHSAYDWRMHKMGHDFYKTKFGEKTFTANKIKELLTEPGKSNFNLLLEYSLTLRGAPLTAGQRSNPLVAKPALPTNGIPRSLELPRNDTAYGYCICFHTAELLHYCYPFYENQHTQLVMPNLGIGMMLRAVIWAKEQRKKYVYLGSAQRPSDTYKLQFEGLEWWDDGKWMDDANKLKQILKLDIANVG